MSKISVIVPVYNAERYLTKCINSILAQTYDDFEVILVNDGSIDSSAEICDAFRCKDKRVKVIHQINSGEMAARASGVYEACGDYYYFVDSDDEIMPDTLSAMYSYMEDDVDIVVFEQKEMLKCTMIEYAQRILSFKCLTVWGKLYRKSVFDNYVLSVSRYFKVGGDFLTQLRLLNNIKRNVVLIPENKYIYNANNINSVQKEHDYTYDYERTMVLEVIDTVKRLLPNYTIERALVKWELIYLGGMIGLKYPIDFEDEWIIKLIENKEEFKFSMKEKLIINSIEYPLLRNILIAEKKIRLFIRKKIKK